MYAAFAFASALSAHRTVTDPDPTHCRYVSSRSSKRESKAKSVFQFVPRSQAARADVAASGHNPRLQYA